MVQLRVPLFRQKKNTCGATSLRMVLGYFGKTLSNTEIVENTGGIHSYGVKAVSLAGFARSLGFKTHCYSYNKRGSVNDTIRRKPSIADIKKFLDRKLPVILAVRTFLLYGTKHSNEGHFIVVTGYGKDRLYYNDSDDAKRHSIREDYLMFALANNVLSSSAYLLVLEPKRWQYETK